MPPGLGLAGLLGRLRESGDASTSRPTVWSAEAWATIKPDVPPDVDSLVNTRVFASAMHALRRTSRGKGGAADVAKVEAMVRAIPQFKGFTPDIVRGLARMFTVVELEAGTQLFNEGEEGDKFYVVLQGQAVVVLPVDLPAEEGSKARSTSGRGRASSEGGSAAATTGSATGAGFTPPPLTTRSTASGGVVLSLQPTSAPEKDGSDDEDHRVSRMRRPDILALPRKQASKRRLRLGSPTMPDDTSAPSTPVEGVAPLRAAVIKGEENAPSPAAPKRRMTWKKAVKAVSGWKRAVSMFTDTLMEQGLDSPGSPSDADHRGDSAGSPVGSREGSRHRLLPREPSGVVSPRLSARLSPPGTPPLLITPRSSMKVAARDSMASAGGGGARLSRISLTMTSDEAAAAAAATRGALATALSLGAAAGGAGEHHPGAAFISGEDRQSRSLRDMLQKATKVVKKAGQCFGESALTKDGNRNAAVVIPTPTTLAVLDGEDYLRVLAHGYDALIDRRVALLRRCTVSEGVDEEKLRRVAHHLHCEHVSRGAVLCTGHGDLVEAANGMERFIDEKGGVGTKDGSGPDEGAFRGPDGGSSTAEAAAMAKKKDVLTAKQRNAAKDAASAALAARVHDDEEKLFYVIASGEIVLRAFVPAEVPTGLVTREAALSQRRRVDRSVAVLGVGDHFSDACLEAFVAGAPRGKGKSSAHDPDPASDDEESASDGRALSRRDAAFSTMLADKEHPAFVCSSGKAEVYSIPLVQLLKLCGSYRPPEAEITVAPAPKHPVTGVSSGLTTFGFKVGRAASLSDLPASDAGRREALWRRRVDRMEGLLSDAVDVAADVADGAPAEPPFGLFRGESLDEPLLDDELMTTHGGAASPKRYPRYQGEVGTLPEDPTERASFLAALPSAWRLVPTTEAERAAQAAELSRAVEEARYDVKVKGQGRPAGSAFTGSSEASASNVDGLSSGGETDGVGSFWENGGGRSGAAFAKYGGGLGFRNRSSGQSSLTSDVGNPFVALQPTPPSAQWDVDPVGTASRARTYDAPLGRRFADQGPGWTTASGSAATTFTDFHAGDAREVVMTRVRLGLADPPPPPKTSVGRRRTAARTYGSNFSRAAHLGGDVGATPAGGDARRRPERRTSPLDVALGDTLDLDSPVSARQTEGYAFQGLPPSSAPSPEVYASPVRRVDFGRRPLDDGVKPALVTAAPFGSRGSSRSLISPGKQAGRAMTPLARGSGAFTRFLPPPPKDAARLTAIATAAAADREESLVFDRDPRTGAVRYVVVRDQAAAALTRSSAQASAHVTITARGKVEVYPKTTPDQGGRERPTLWSRDSGDLEAPLADLASEVPYRMWDSEAYEEDPKATPFTERRYAAHADATVDPAGITRRAIVPKPVRGPKENHRHHVTYHAATSTPLGFLPELAELVTAGGDAAFSFGPYSGSVRRGVSRGSDAMDWFGTSGLEGSRMMPRSSRSGTLPSPAPPFGGGSPPVDVMLGSYRVQTPSGEAHVFH